MKKIMVVFLLTFLCTVVFAQQQGTLLVANKEDNTLSFIDPAKQKVVATIPVGQGPHEVAVSPSGKTATVANYGNRTQAGNSISVIDVVNQQTVKIIDLGEYTRPHGMEFINEEEVLVTCETKGVLLRVNTKTNRVSEVAQTAQQTTHMVTYSHNDQTAYTANIRSGTASVIDVPQNKLLRNITGKPGIEGLAVSPDGKELWLANQTENTITVINTATFEKMAEFAAEPLAYRVHFLPNGKYVAVSNGKAGSVSIYDVSAKKLLKIIDLITDPAKQPVPGGITASVDNRWLYVCTTAQNQVVMIDTATWTVAGRIDTGNSPDGIYFSIVTTK